MSAKTTLPKIWFLRHGQTEWNLERRLQGRLDSPLTPEGVAQAEAQARLIAPALAEVAGGPGGLFVSPLGRAQQTARIALGDVAYRVDERLAEIDTGDWEGRLRDELGRGGPDLEAYADAPGGEGFTGLNARVTQFLETVQGPSIVVSHGLWGQVMRGRVQGLDRSEMATLDNRQGVVYVLENGQETVLA